MFVFRNFIFPHDTFLAGLKVTLSRPNNELHKSFLSTVVTFVNQARVWMQD